MHADDGVASKEQPLIEDIRLLGKLLGDVIREQEGEATFELVENIRQLSVAYRLKHDAGAGAQMDSLLKGLSLEQTVQVVRAFSYFSHLANIAEDNHYIRRRVYHERRGDVQAGSLQGTLERLQQQGVSAQRIAGLLQTAHVSPVLTAHPTEVQSTIILTAERAIAQLVAERDQGLTPRAIQGLIERDYGTFERGPMADVPANVWDPGDALIPYGGEGNAALRGRMITALRELLAPDNVSCALAVSHGSASQQFLKACMPVDGVPAKLPNCAIMVCDYAPATGEFFVKDIVDPCA